MRFAVLAVCGFVLDALFGDPAWLPHPVCAVGALISRLEKRLRRIFPPTPRGETAAGVLLWLFLGTRLGLSIRATGDNRDMVRASSVNPTITITVGLCISNALTALSGAVVGQAQRSVDINLGTGIVVIGLACLIFGESMLGRRTILKGVIAVMVGSIIYRFIYAVVLFTKVVPVDCLKLITAALVALAIAFPTIKGWGQFQLRKLNWHKHIQPAGGKENR